MPELSHDEIAEFLGAYALDALDPEQVAMVEIHIAECPRCADEVEEHRGVAGLLANSGGDAPEHLWDRIAAQIERPDAIDEHPPVTSLFPRPSGDTGSSAGRGRNRRRRWISNPWLTGAVAAGIVVIAALGIQVSRLNNRVGQLQAAGQQAALTQAAENALADPHARRVALTAAHSSGPAIAEIVVLPSGRAFVVDDHLPALASDQTYQLWGQVGSQLVSLGLLGGRPADAPFRVDPGVVISSFAVTAERAGGVVQTTHVPVAVSQTISA